MTPSKLFLYFSTLLVAFAPGSTASSDCFSSISRSRVARVASISMGLGCSTHGKQITSGGGGNLYFSLQANGTVVAVDLEKRRRAFAIGMPGVQGFVFFPDVDILAADFGTKFGNSLTAFNTSLAINSTSGEGRFLYAVESTVSLAPEQQGGSKPNFLYFNKRLYYSGLAGLEYINISTGEIVPNLIPASVEVTFFPGTSSKAYATLFGGQLASFDLASASYDWIIPTNNGSYRYPNAEFKGEDDRFVYVSNASVGGSHQTLLLFEKHSTVESRSGQFELTLLYNLNGTSEVGFGSLLSPRSSFFHRTEKSTITLTAGTSHYNISTLLLPALQPIPDEPIAPVCTSTHFLYKPYSITSSSAPAFAWSYKGELLFFWSYVGLQVYSYPGAKLLAEFFQKQPPVFLSLIEESISSNSSMASSSFILVGQRYDEIQVVEVVLVSSSQKQHEEASISILFQGSLSGNDPMNAHGASQFGPISPGLVYSYGNQLTDRSKFFVVSNGTQAEVFRVGKT